MKWLGILMAFSCCTAAGFCYAKNIAEKRHICEEMLNYWQAFRQLLATSLENPLLLVQRLGEGSTYENFSFSVDMKHLIGNSRSLRDAMDHLLEKKSDYAFLSHCLSPLGEALGYLPIEMELQTLDTVLLRLEQERCRWAEKESKQAGLSRRMGLLCGILLVVVLL